MLMHVTFTFFGHSEASHEEKGEIAVHLHARHG